MIRHFSNILLLCAGLVGVANAATKVDWVIAIVNEEVILNSQLKEEKAFFTNRIRSTGQSLPADSEFDEFVINILLERKLQLQRARLIVEEPSSVEIERALRGMLSNSGKELGRFLLDEGISEANLRRRIGEDLMINEALRLDNRQAIIEMRLNQSAINEALRAVNLAENDMREYLLEHAQLDLADAGLAEELRSLQGDEFLLRAQQDSGAVALKKLEWLRPDQLRPVFYDAVKGLKPGNNSQVLELEDGLHVLHLVARRPLVPGQTREQTVKLKLLRVQEDRGQLEQARNQIIVGDSSFEEIAEELGGQVEVGEFDLTKLPASIKHGLRLRLGELGGPFDTDNGFVLAMVLDVKMELVGDARLRDRVASFVVDNRVEQIRRKWIENLRAIGKIEILRESS